MITPFEPRHALLRNAHLQTVISSSALRKKLIRRYAGDLIRQAVEHVIPCGSIEGEPVRLQAWLSHASSRANGPVDIYTDPEAVSDAGDTPLAILIHGWLGGDESSYLLSAAAALHRAGFTVARLNLRDHGDTHHLNRGLFHSARTAEVVSACAWLISKYGQAGCGLLGFSLGGNFVLRVAADLDASLPLKATLAVCPVIDPEPTMVAIDSGWSGYQWYFVRKWHRALAAKQAAFPKDYDFSSQKELGYVSTLTDYFVDNYTDFRNSQEYFANYSLTGQRLAGLARNVTVIAAKDDPVIPAETFEHLPTGLPIELYMQRYGGHCGFIQDFRLHSWLDEQAVNLFRARIVGR